MPYQAPRFCFAYREAAIGTMPSAIWLTIRALPARSAVNTFLSRFFAVAAVLCAVLPLPAETKHVPTFDEQLSLKRVDAPRISPDGR
jgi:hypothetical protein